MPSLLAACVVHQLRPDSGTYGVTAIDKRPLDGPVKVNRYGLRSDVQADRKHHGGIDQAIYAYSQSDADFWAAELGRPLAPGWFGENLRVDGIDLREAREGDRWRIGDRVVAEVTHAREPCATFARWVGSTVDRESERGWVRRFGAEGRLGAYLRVVTVGQLAAGDSIEVDVAAGAPAILDVFRVQFPAYR
jgi:MOSC domain-containing protein YiiM